MLSKRAIVVGLCILGGGCRDASDRLRPDASTIDAVPDAVDNEAGCVSEFGQDMANGFGRFDGTLVAVVPPGSFCPRPNSTHIILEVRANDQVYRMVAAVMSSSGVPTMALAERDAALVGPAWSEGWHVGAEYAFDYVDNMNLHRLDFMPLMKDDMVDAINRKMIVGGKVSVFATVEDQPDSAHLVHRNAPGKDGAIIVNADGAPHYLMLRFDNQLF
ncbi:MAG: hypothetical protein HOV81_02440 [Kofleriaceae bacterium]|nr:hypothetical protein [Kofleriaceae bacterium]